MGNKRNRRTDAEMLEHFKKEQARLEAKMAGKIDTSTESGKLKAIKRRLRKTTTELKAARFTLEGSQPGPDGKGMVRSSIDDKIKQTQARLASQIETRDRATAFAAKLPFDIERLEALLAAAEQGDDVDMPDDLTPLSDESKRTDEEHEAAFATKDDESEG